MRIVQQWMPAALSLVLGACANLETAAESHDLAAQSAALSNERSEQTTFLVKRDLKKCSFPRCGGFYVTKLNQDKLTCADGKRARECYVASIEFENGLTADDGELVRGTLTVKNFGEKGWDFGVLVATAAFTPAVSEGLAKPVGSFYVPYDTGIRCIRQPCNSMGALALNTGHTKTVHSVAFARKNADEKALIESAFFDGMSETLEAAKAGKGNVVVGKFQERFDRFSKQWLKELSVTNVFSEKVLEHRQCVVHGEGSSFTAWNVTSEVDVDALVANLTGDVSIMEGACGEIQTPCPMVYRPVHGLIDALGEQCTDASNACAFRGAVIAAAGLEGKASGSFTDGRCDVACASDDDCVDGFCGWTAEDTRVCRPFAQEGEHCEGFVVPEARTFCRPDLTCVFSEATGDAGGTCQPAN
jgi:hypothetical protein